MKQRRRIYRSQMSVLINESDEISSPSIYNMLKFTNIILTGRMKNDSTGQCLGLC